MNVSPKVPAQVSPQRPVKLQGSLGGFDGATKYSREFSTWHPSIKSPDVAYLPDKTLAQGRVEDSVRNDPYIKGALRDRRDAIVGDNYLLTLVPDSRVLFGKRDEVWESEFSEEVESWWDISTKGETWIDASRKHDFTEMIRLICGIRLLRGEVFGAFEYIADQGRPFSTALNLISGDRIGNPSGITTNQANVREGIKFDQYGAPISYMVSSEDPYDFGMGFLSYGSNVTWKEIPKYTSWGRLQMMHIFTQEGAAQTRGIPELVTGLKTMKVFRDLRDITLQRAAVAASVVGTITSDMSAEKLFQALGMDTPQAMGLSPDLIRDRIDNFVGGYFQSILSAGTTSVDGVRLPHLYPGTKLEFHNLGSGEEVGSDFGKSQLRAMSALLGTSYEEVSHDINVNYAALKGGLALTRKSVLCAKKQIADDAANKILKPWMEEMICKRVFTTLPKRFCNLDFLWSNPLRMHALSRAHWIGATSIQIDELKESTASALRIQNGLSTWSTELAKTGQDWRQIFRQMAREKQLAEALNLDISQGIVSSVRPVVSKEPNGVVESVNDMDTGDISDE